MAETRSRVLAIDYGTKRLGLAISDELQMFAHPRGTIANGPAMMDEILTLIHRETIRTVVLGIPRTLSNTESEMTSEVLQFGETLMRALEPLGIKLERRDERLTSLIAETNIRARELPKQKREQKYLRDEEAARIVLQEYLDQLKNG